VWWCVCCSMARSETPRAVSSAMSLVSMGDQKILHDSPMLLGALKKKQLVATTLAKSGAQIPRFQWDSTLAQASAAVGHSTTGSRRGADLQVVGGWRWRREANLGFGWSDVAKRDLCSVAHVRPKLIIGPDQAMRDLIPA